MIDTAHRPAPDRAEQRSRCGEEWGIRGYANPLEEHFGGFTLIKCDDLDEALKWAANLPSARDGSVEIRHVIQVQPEPERP